MQSTHFFETPKFSGKEDPNLWIFRFEKTAKLNNWSDDIKLQYVDNCFNEDLQLWCMEKNFAVWSDFKSAFLDKYTKRVDSDKIISSIISFKMQPSESVTKYITRFEKLVLELRKNKLVKFNIEDAKYDTGETKDEPKIKGKSKLMELKEDKQELHITETGLIKYFIKGIPSRSIRTLLKAEKPTTLTMLYASLRDMSESDNESEASDSDTEQIATKLTKTENKSLKNDSIPTKQVEPNAINNLIDKFQNMTLLIGELMERVEPVKTKRNSACYNCQSNDHYSRDCTAPCKLCNSSGHKHYECPKHPKNNPATNNQNGESFMIEEEEHYMAEKRKLVDINPTRESPRNKRKGRTTKPAPVYESKPLPTIANTPNPIYLNNASDTVMQEPTSHANPIPIQVKTQSQPEHPLLPLKDKSQIEEIARKKAEEIIHNIISEKVHKVSLLDIAEISPVARTGIKSSITKPRIRNPKAPIKVVDVKPSTISAEGLNLMLGEVEYQQPKGRSAPRTKGVINGRPCEIILDGGCTSYIISLEFARKIGISQLEPIAASVMFGDGGSRQPIGLARNVHIELSGKVNICVHALCFDVKDSYQFIIGRDGFFALGVGTDWRTHFWYLRTDNGNIPIDVYYTKNGVKEYNSNRVVPTLAEENEDSDSDYQYDDEDFVDQDESEEGFLIIEDYDSYSQPTTHENISESNQGRLGNLLDRIRNQNNISTKEKQDLCDTILEFQDCFGTNYNHLGTTNLLKFHVDTGDAKPIYKRPYNFLSYSEKETLKSDLAEMVNNGILIPNTHVPGNSKQAGWSFPCRYVPKKTGDKRLVTNFQDLNAVTVRDTWPLPSVVDVLEHLAGAQWFSVCDLLKAFQQIAVEEESIPKLTIATPWGTYSYRCMPFGVLNGPSCFSRCVYLAIEPFLGRFATNFLDDCTLFAKEKANHLENIREFLTRMREVNLKLNANKCDFYQEEIQLLGFVVNKEGVRPAKSKLDKILDFPRPTNETGIRAFVNLAGFYRRHVPGFADLTHPLNELLKKRNPFIWSETCEVAFNNIKHALSKATLLHIPGSDTNYRLYTDASEIGIGACLSAVLEDGTEKPVVFLSRKLQPAETRYPTVEKELLAVIYAMKKLRKYILDKKFTLYCDNTAVCYLFNKTEPSQRLQRWVMCTQEFQFDVIHLPSTKNSVADALSRFPPKIHNETQDGEDLIDEMFDHLLVLESDVYEDWIQDLVRYFENPGSPSVTDKIKRLSLKYKYENKTLYRKAGLRYLMVPRIQHRAGILTEVHDGHGHYGINATWARLFHSYWWPKCYSDIKDFIHSCRACQLFDRVAKSPPLDQIPIHYLFEQFAIDFVGPLPETRNGNKYLLVAVEAFSRWPVAKPTTSTDAKVVAEFLYKEIFCVFGPPTHLLSDNGSSFDNDIVDNFVNMVRTKHQFTSPYRPSTNGRVEQMNGNLVKALKKICIDSPTTWDEEIDAVLYAYRTKAHSALRISPYEFLFGLAPLSARQDPLQELGRALGYERGIILQDRHIQVDDYNILNQEYDHKHRARPKYFAPGTLVVRLRQNRTGKMQTTFKPEIFTVVNSFANGTCQLADHLGRFAKRRVNISSLRKFVPRDKILGGV